MVRYFHLMLCGLMRLAVRYAVALVGCVAIWWSLFVLRPCEPGIAGWIASSDCSVLGRTMRLGGMSWFDWTVLGLVAVLIVLLWMIVALALWLWRVVETAARQGRFAPALGFSLLYGIALALCILADQLAVGLKPCFGDFVEGPGYLFGCYVFKADLPMWPSVDPGHFLSLALFASILVVARLVFSWNRG